MAAFHIEDKLVIAIASSALFNLAESDEVYKKEGVDAYRKYQKEKLNHPFAKGVAFPFIRRLLNLNKLYPEKPVEVIFLSRNDPYSGQRMYRSAQHYELEITRGAFLAGRSPHEYINAFNASLFLTANKDDAIEAIKAKFPAGIVLESAVSDDENDSELRIAFDFDGVLADDESERVFSEGQIEAFMKNETEKKDLPHEPGPLKDLLDKISKFQKIEAEAMKKDTNHKPALRIAIITARNAPANERFVTTLESWNISVDETFFLGGIEKSRILKVFKPHIFFDDQKGHLEPTSTVIPSVHIPFGIKNKE